MGPLDTACTRAGFFLVCFVVPVRSFFLHDFLYGRKPHAGALGPVSAFPSGVFVPGHR